MTLKIIAATLAFVSLPVMAISGGCKHQTDSATPCEAGQYMDTATGKCVKITNS